MTGGPTGSLHVERDGHVLRLTLSRPQVRNALDDQLVAALTAVLGDVGDARVVLLAGAGHSFSAGADVDAVTRALDGDEAEVESASMRMHAMLEAVQFCPAPVLCRVQGHAVGGGAGLAAASDVVVAHTSAVFAFPEVSLGMVPTGIVPFALARIGVGQARRYLVTGERFDAATALRMGLVHEVAQDLDATVERIASGIVAAGPGATRATKQLILRRAGSADAAAHIAPMMTAETREGLAAFMERRRPAWTQPDGTTRDREPAR